MIFEHLIKANKEAFLSKVEEICRYLSIEPDWLMLVMWFETARTFRADILNPFSKAVGLIQWMPVTARLLGTTTEALKNMSNVEQLDYVRRYLAPYAGKMKNWLDVYCAVFYPLLIGKPDSYVIDREIVARENPVFDLNNDLKIHKHEIREALQKSIPQQYKHLFK